MDGGLKKKKAPSAKLTEDQVHAIIALKPEKEPYSSKAVALGSLLNVSSTTIRNIWIAKSWRHITRTECLQNTPYGRQNDFSVTRG